MHSYRAAIFNDVHYPFNDPRLLELVLQAIKDANVDKLIINGDLLDFYSISAYGPKSPIIREKLEDEIMWGAEFFKKLRSMFPDTEIIFLYGNHSHRLAKYIWQNCAQLVNYISLDKLLQLDHYDIEWHEYQDFYKMEGCDLRVVHSPPSYSVNGAMASLKKKVDASFVYGCTHRLDSAYQTGIEGKLYRAYFNGWLGNKNHYIKWLEENEDELQAKVIRQVFSYMKSADNWQCGFSFVSVHDGFFHVEQIPIENGRFICNGFYYEL